MTTDEITSILTKVQKLMALAANAGATPDEAAAAAARAQQLLFKHNLSMADIESLDEAGRRAVEMGADTFQLGRDATMFMVGWHRNLVFGLASTNFCRAIVIDDVPDGGVHVEGRKAKRLYANKMQIIGERQNIEFVKWLYSHVSEQIEKMASAAVKRHCPPDFAPGRKGVWVRDFSMGAVRTVIQRLRDQRRKDEADIAGTSMALVVVTKDDQAKQLYDQLHPKKDVKQMHLAPVRGGDAYGRGKKAGEKIGLNRPLGGGQKGVK